MNYHDDPQLKADKALAPSRRQALKKKDTRRWCRGKVGVEHTPEIVMGQSWGKACSRGGHYDRQTQTWNADVVWVCYHVQSCTGCGKHLETVVECPERPADVPLLYEPRRSVT